MAGAATIGTTGTTAIIGVMTARGRATAAQAKAAADITVAMVVAGKEVAKEAREAAAAEIGAADGRSTLWCVRQASQVAGSHIAFADCNRYQPARDTKIK